MSHMAKQTTSKKMTVRQSSPSIIDQWCTNRLACLPTLAHLLSLACNMRGQRGRVVREPDLKSVGRGPFQIPF